MCRSIITAANPIISIIHKVIILITYHLSLITFSAQAQPAWRDSLAVLNQAISQNPTSTDLRLKKAAVNIELNQWDYAIEEYGRVLQIAPRNLSALYFRAYAHNHLRQYDLARADYEAFLAIMPKHFEAQLGLAMVKRNLGRTADALDDLNTVVQLFPDSAMAYAARAGLEAELRMYEPALFDWDEAISRQPANLDLIVSKADLLLKLKRRRQARRLLLDAVKNGAPRAVLDEWIKQCE